MPFAPEEAKVIASYTLATYERERTITQRVIAAIPAGQEQYRPDPISKSTLELAFHLASSEWFFLTGASSGSFSYGEHAPPENIKTAQDVLAWYEEKVPPALAAAKAMPAEDVNRIIDFYGMMQAPAFAYLTLMVNHSAHHRGQLSAYLRPMGAKVPSIYGPSGDKE